MFKKIKPLVATSAFVALFSSPMISAASINQGMFKPDGTPQDGANIQQGMSRSGRYVLFSSVGSRYLRDIKTQTSIFIANGSGFEFALSPNGRYVALVRTVQFNPVIQHSVVLDRVTNIETIIPAKREASIGLSNNGYVLFVKQVGVDTQIIRLNLNDSSETIIATGDVSLGSNMRRNPLSADGNVVLFESANTFRVYNATTQQITVLAPTRTDGWPIIATEVDLASSGKFVAITDNNPHGDDIFRLDLTNGQQTAAIFDMSLKNISMWEDANVSISADGRFISFRGEIEAGHPEWLAAKLMDPDNTTQGYPRIFRYDTLTDSLVTMTTAHDGGLLLAAPGQSSPVRPIVNNSTIISDDGSMVELSTSSHNIVSTPVSQSMSEANYHIFSSTGFNRNYQFVDIPHSDINFKPFAPMTLVGNNLWEGTITFDGVGAESFKFDVGGTLVNGKFTATPHWAINFGAGGTANQAVANGANIPVTGGAGTYKITFNDQTLAYSITKEVSSGNWQRTVVFIEGQTQTGQDMFIRGGIDHAFAQNNLGLTCTEANKLCAIPIRHLNLRNTTTAPWKANDTVLDWYGAETGQSTASQGSPLDWTINVWPASWGTKRTVAIDGFGETPLNLWGAHYWMFEVEMDCAKTFNGWFELKSFISGGPGWEGNVSQPGAPYVSGNHFAQCGKLNVFRRNQSNPVTIGNF